MIKKKIKMNWRVNLVFMIVMLIGVGLVVYSSFNKKEDKVKETTVNTVVNTDYKTVGITKRIEDLSVQKQLQNVTVDKEAINVSLEAKRVQYVQDRQQDDTNIETAAYFEYNMLNPQTTMSEEDFVILSKLVMAEAENQTPDAQYYVACVVLNRIKSPLFPNTMQEVVYQKGQFTCIWNGRYNSIDLSTTPDDFYHNVERALIYNELPSDVLYFTSDHYLAGTIPYMEVDDMNFSRQK